MLKNAYYGNIANPNRKKFKNNILQGAYRVVGILTLVTKFKPNSIMESKNIAQNTDYDEIDLRQLVDTLIERKKRLFSLRLPPR